MKYHVQEGAVHMQCAVVVQEAQLPEFVHKVIDARPRRTDHFSKEVLIHMGEGELLLPFLAEVRQEQQDARETFLARIKQLID